MSFKVTELVATAVNVDRGAQRMTMPKDSEPRQSLELATPMDQRAIRALAACTFLPGSYVKRFAKNLASSAQEPGLMLTSQRAGEKHD